MSETLAQAIERANRAEAANQAKSEFLAILSHELRVSLTSIIGMAQLLNLDCLLPEQHVQVADMLQSSEHLLSLADELLEVAQLEAGRIELKAIPFDFAKLVKEMVNMLQFQAQAKGIQLFFHYEKSAPRLVWGDENVLRQIILNLVSNALKFTLQGSIFVEIKCQQQTPQNVVLLLTIADTGIGIAPKELDALLASFNRVDGEYIHRYRNIGLGLAITHTYLKLMGATLQVNSQLGSGSQFTCVIPFQLQDLPQEQTNLSSHIMNTFMPFTRKKPIRILLVEDTPLIQKVHKLMLEKLGCEVDIAANAEQALTMHSNSYELIFMDVGLPEVSGLEITQEIRRREGQYKHTPIIAMTGYAHDYDRQNCFKAGMDEVAVKPVKPETMKHLIQQWISI